MARRVLCRGARGDGATMWWIAAAWADPEDMDLAEIGDLEAPAPVVGGAPVAAGDWEDTVGVVFDGAYVGCTGTLIAPDVVLTAGHCAGGISHIVVGTNDWTRGGDWIPVSRTHEHPSSQSTYDVAVLELSRPAEVPPRAVGMDCILEEYLRDAAEVAIVGYGATNGAGTAYTERLQEGYTAIADADCSEDRIDGWWSGCNQGARPDGELAAGGDGVDSCFGDSGGPLYLLTPSGDFLVGVTSRSYAGVPWNQPCLYGGIYTRPDAVIDWIEDQVGPVEKPYCNHRPEPSADPIEVREGETALTEIRTGDPDARQGDVTYRIVEGPAHGRASVGADGTVTYEADGGWTGEDRLVVEVDDGGNPDWPRTGLPLAGEVEIDVTVVPGTGSPDAVDLDGDGVADASTGGSSYLKMGCGCRSAGGGGWLVVLVAAGIRRRVRYTFY